MLRKNQELGSKMINNNIHEGHRKRLIETVSKVGLDNLSDIQALEFILFYIFPRGDVNPLAHRLLNRFNNTATILEASIEDLMEVEGMGKTSSQKLHLILEVLYYYTLQKVNNVDCLKTLGEFYDYIEQLLRYRKEEELYLFGVNASGEVVKGRRFAKGTLDMVGIELRDIALYISTYKVKAVFLVHNHPEGSCKASTQDEISYNKLKGVFNFSGCKLLDSLVVGKDGIYSMEKHSMQRIFSEGLEYLQALLQETPLRKKL